VARNNKTKATTASVDAFVKGLEDAERRKDAKAVLQIMGRVTGLDPRMWGPSIVGFGSYHYVYESGREGDAPMVGFAPRGREMTLYVLADFPRRDALLAKLGKHRTGKSCLYIRRLADVDLVVLEKLVTASVADRRKRYSTSLGERSSQAQGRDSTQALTPPTPIESLPMTPAGAGQAQSKTKR
jgi:hypothetical protein